MARTDNLSNYLTDIADAIKTKKGSSTAINASTFDTEILNLPTGSGLEYETGTFTTTQASQNPQINFNNTHTDIPAFICLVKADNTAPAINGITLWQYVDYEKMTGYPTHYQGTSSIIKTYAQAFTYFQRNATQGSSYMANISRSSTDTGDSSKTYPRYWVNSAWFKLHLDEMTSSYPDLTTEANVDYNWIAIWV